MWIAVDSLWISVQIHGKLEKIISFAFSKSIMNTAYSGKALIEKLGIKPGLKLQLINIPDDYFNLLEVNPEDQLCKKNETANLIHLFVKTKKEFGEEMKKIKKSAKKNP